MRVGGGGIRMVLSLRHGWLAVAVSIAIVVSIKVSLSAQSPIFSSSRGAMLISQVSMPRTQDTDRFARETDQQKS